MRKVAIKMEEPNICPICKKNFGDSSESSTELKQHITKMEDPFHQLLTRYRRLWPAAPYYLSMMEIRPEMEKLMKKYGKPKRYEEKHVIH
jgi:hypothetical protein